VLKKEEEVALEARSSVLVLSEVTLSLNTSA
jgi:hypothetical protein